MDVARVVPTQSRAGAQIMSGLNLPRVPKITVVGVGALGSQVVMNLSRQGFAKWVLLDKDVFLPINLTRHALLADSLGRSKAQDLAAHICCMLWDKEAAVANELDVMRVQDSPERLELLKAADNVYDFSASQAVARHLARFEGVAPISSAFMAAGGNALVVMREGQVRSVRLDDLDEQMSFAACEHPSLADLFVTRDEEAIRYGRSCGDVSTVLAQDVVATHAAIASQFLKQSNGNPDASIDVWRLSPSDLTVSRYSLTPASVRVSRHGAWEIRFSEHAIRQMRCYRRSRLPNETGGILVGSIDVGSSIV